MTRLYSVRLILARFLAAAAVFNLDGSTVFADGFVGLRKFQTQETHSTIHIGSENFSWDRTRYGKALTLYEPDLDSRIGALLDHSRYSEIPMPPAPRSTPAEAAEIIRLAGQSSDLQNMVVKTIYFERYVAGHSDCTRSLVEELQIELPSPVHPRALISTAEDRVIESATLRRHEDLYESSCAYVAFLDGKNPIGWNGPDWVSLLPPQNPSGLTGREMFKLLSELGERGARVTFYRVASQPKSTDTRSELLGLLVHPEDLTSVRSYISTRPERPESP